MAIHESLAECPGLLSRGKGGLPPADAVQLKAAQPRQATIPADLRAGRQRFPSFDAGQDCLPPARHQGLKAVQPRPGQSPMSLLPQLEKP